MSSAAPEYSFIYRNGAYLVYIAFFLAVVPNSYAAITHFGDGRWIFGIWAIVGIYLCPRSVMGLMLVLGRSSGVIANIPPVLIPLFANTIEKYRWIYSGFGFRNPVLRGSIREVFWLVVSWIPFMLIILK